MLTFEGKIQAILNVVNTNNIQNVIDKINVIGGVMDKGVNILNIPNNLGTIPLIIAIKNNNIELVKLLLSKGADVNKIANNESPLLVASQFGHDLIVKLLLDTPGVNINIMGIDKETPLFKAAQNGKTNVVELLLSKGADANLSDGFDTPLLAAIKNFRLNPTPVVRLLLEKGVDANQPDKNGKLPVEIASERQQTDVVNLLLENGPIDYINNQNLGRVPNLGGGRRKKRKTNKKKTTKRRKSYRKKRC